MNITISLVEFGDEKTFSIEKLKNWFPTGKFDKRYPQEYLKKWTNTNKKYLEFLGISCKWDDERKSLVLAPTNKIGLAPLKNPYGKKVYGSIVVKPRLGWTGIYEILEAINWKYQPLFLKGEEPIISNGVLPRWFKAIATLEAISQALNLLMKGMERRQIISKLPIGNINWNAYSTESVPYGKYDQFTSLITDYSIDLDIHRQFKGTVALIMKDILNPIVPIRLKIKAKQLIDNIERKLKNVEYSKPDVKKLTEIKLPNFYRSLYEKAIKRCIEYLNQSKFSIDTGNFYGLPWALKMDRLFEYWIEHWAYVFARKIGARFYSDIRNNSRIRFYNLGHWKSLSALRPDVVIEKGHKTLIIEAKYKKHLLYLQSGKHSTEIKEEHRRDVHQLLSYMSTSSNKKRIGCLIYPKIDDNTPNQIASLINYTNAKADTDIILCASSFHPEDMLNSLEHIWGEEYSPL